MMAQSSIHNAKHWLDRAAEARIQAEQMTDPDLRRRMLEVAKGYDRMAEELGRPRAAGAQKTATRSLIGPSRRARGRNPAQAARNAWRSIAGSGGRRASARKIA